MIEAYSLDQDPLCVLLRMEADEEDSMEVESECEVRESVLLAALLITKTVNFKE